MEERRTVSYDLAQWTAEQREDLATMLDGEGIPYEVEDDELTVLATHERDVDRMLDSLGQPASRRRTGADVFAVLRRVAVALAAAVALWQAAPLFTTGGGSFSPFDCGVVVVELFGDNDGDEGDESDEPFGVDIDSALPGCQDLAQEIALTAAARIAAAGLALVIALRVLREDGPF